MIDTKCPSIEFTAHDRCDKCGAQAYAAYKKDDLELLFCLHHAKQHNLTLECEGWQPYYDLVALERLIEPERVGV
jgi:hypothetical protein